MDFIDHMVFVCCCGVAISMTFLIIGGLFELINYLSKGKFQNWITNLFSEQMEKIEMDIAPGACLNDMYEQLNKHYNFVKARREKYGRTGEFVVYGIFNGVEILHTDTPDEISIKVTGKTVAEQEEAFNAYWEEYDRKEREHKANIPELTKKYKKEARGVIPENKLELWDKIVPIRLGDLYQGMELNEWLKMVKVLNEDLPKEERFSQVKEIFDSAGHSGTSGGLVLSGLCEFHPDGKECAEYIRKEYE